jgi:hypothetical protein
MENAHFFTCDVHLVQCKILYELVASRSEKEWIPIPSKGIKRCAEQKEWQHVPGTVAAFLVKGLDDKFREAVPVVNDFDF